MSTEANNQTQTSEGNSSTQSSQTGTSGDGQNQNQQTNTQTQTQQTQQGNQQTFSSQFNQEVNPGEQNQQAVDDGSFELTFPDNSHLSEDDRDAIVEIVEKAGMDQYQAQVYADSMDKVFEQGRESYRNEMSAQDSSNREALLKHEAFATEEAQKKSFAVIDQVVQEFAGDDYQEMVKLASGPLGNSLPFAKFLLKIGESMKSDSFETKNKKGANTNTGDNISKEDFLRQKYPTMFKD